MTPSGVLLFLSVGGMELCWLYACATFLTTSFLQQPFPLPEAIGSFLLAAAFTSLSQGRGWRVITVLAVQLIGFIPALWRMGHIFNSWSGSFAAHVSSELFNGTMSPSDWIISMLVLLWGFLFWRGGVNLARRPQDYLTLCQRFDLGVGAFFLLLLARYAITATGPGRAADSSEWLLFAFFLCALTAIALARSRSATSPELSSGAQGIGIAMLFAAAILLLGGGAMLSSLPRLTGVAQAGYGVLKTASRPLVSVFLALLRFLMGGEDLSAVRTPLAKSKLLHEATQGSGNWWMQLLGEALAWVARIFLGLAVLATLCLILYFTVRGLLSRTESDPGRRNPFRLAPLWARLRGLAISLQNSIARALDRYPRGIGLYASLLGWGRRSGLRRVPEETPREYGSRLASNFPGVGPEIGLIVEAFHQEFYGETVLGQPQLDEARSAARRLKSPAHWVPRLKTRFLRHGDSLFRRERLHDSPLAARNSKLRR